MFTRTFRMSAVSAAAALVVTGVGATAAVAAPVKPGRPTVSASASEPSIGTYDVAVSWTAVTGATSYRATITRSGTTLSSTILTTTSWDQKVTATPGQTLAVSVKALIGHKSGKAGTRSIPLADEIAPRGSYTSTFVTDTGAATITQDSLTDDSPVSQVTRTVDWGDDSGVQAWPIGTTIDHSYDLVEARYVPTVTLTDSAGHTTIEHSTGVVVKDHQAPTGSFAVGQSTAWAGYSQVTVAQSALADNWSPAAAIARSVDWGDGTTSAWTSGSTVTHVYATAGSFTPAVTITDEAHNQATVQTSSVVVTADTVGPRVRLTLPRARHSVKAWKTLRGKATDAGTGVKTVSLKAVEKRHGHWYGYNAVTHTWLEATTKAKAFGRSKALNRTTDGLHRWTAKLVGLGKGTLVYKVWAIDQVKNRSATVTHQATLTTR